MSDSPRAETREAKFWGGGHRVGPLFSFVKTSRRHD